MLTIGHDDLECDSFRVKGSYGKTIARLFALPVAVESTEPLTLEVTLKGNFRPPKIKRRVYWKKKFIGDFIISSVAQEWDGDRYRTRLELKQCERNNTPDDEIPLFKWRHDLTALTNNLPETDGALLAAGRTIDPFANSWKLAGAGVDSADEDNADPAVLPVSLGGTGSSDPRIALLNLGGVDSATIGLPFGVAPLGSDGKVPVSYLPPGGGGGGGGGSSVTFPITVAQGGTNALDAATARQNLGAIGLAELLAGLDTKADVAAVSSALALKVDTSTYTAGLALKVDTSTYTAGLALKVDTSTYTAGLGTKVDTSTYTAGLGTKVDTSTYTAGLALKVDTSTYTAGLALKLDTASRNAANGVAGLDANSLLAIGQIPIAVQFQHLVKSGGSNTFDFNTLNTGSAAIKWIDSNAGNTNSPSGVSTGSLIQYDPLYAVSGLSNLYKLQILNNSGSQRTFERQQSNGTWGTWFERAYLNKAQTFLNLQDFTAGATFKGGVIPPVTTTLTQAGINAEGLPVYWLVNASATAGNRLKSITIAANGNIRFTHHADDGTAGNVLEHTASGNVLTNGTVRPGSGAVTFTGAQFVPGSTYFRTDLLGDSGAGSLTYSDGSIWRRVSDGSPITESAKLTKILTGTTAATQGGVVSIAHGVPGGKITSVTGVIRYAASHTVPIPGFQPNYQCHVSTDPTTFYLTNVSGQSAAILSLPFSVIIEYTT